MTIAVARDKWTDIGSLGGSEAANRYAEAMHRRPLSYFVSRVEQLGLSGGSAVDVGCGTGTWSMALRSRFDEVIGLDYSEERVSLGQKIIRAMGIDGVDLARADIRRLPITGSSIDLVFCYSVLISALPLDECFEEFYRVLAPGGWAYVSLNGLGFQHYLARRRGQTDGRAKALGEAGLYNSWCQNRLTALAAKLRPGGSENERAKKILAGRASLDVLFTTKSEREAWAAITTDLGDSGGELFRSDVAKMVAGDATEFSHAKAGRGYEPAHVKAVTLRTGFKGFVYGSDGTLSVRGARAVRASCASVKPIHEAEFEGYPKVWEFLVRKPVTRP